MGGRTPQRPVLCNCRVAGCGSSTTWCPSRLENIPGRLIPKALCARHRHLDKYSHYLEGLTDDSQGDCTPTDGLDTVNDTDDFGVQVPDNESHLRTCSDHENGLYFSTVSGSAESLRCLQEQTKALEDALHDLMHLCSVVTQRIMSFSPSTDLVFSRSGFMDSDSDLYERFSLIPPKANMGHRQLSPSAPQNASTLTYECDLYKVLVALGNFSGFPSIEGSRLRLISFVEDELHRIDAIRQAAWNEHLVRGPATELHEEEAEGKEKTKQNEGMDGTHVVVNTGILSPSPPSRFLMASGRLLLQNHRRISYRRCSKQLLDFDPKSPLWNIAGTERVRFSQPEVYSVPCRRCVTACSRR